MSETHEVWMYHLPGYYAAEVPISSDATERDVRAWLRRWLKVKRLPAGTEVYRNPSSWARDIARLNQRAGFNAQTDF